MTDWMMLHPYLTLFGWCWAWACVAMAAYRPGLEEAEATDE